MLKYTGDLQLLVDNYGFQKRFSEKDGSFVKVIKPFKTGDTYWHMEVHKDRPYFKYGFSRQSSNDLTNISYLWDKNLYELIKAGLLIWEKPDNEL